jgi:hypothetical protein
MSVELGENPRPNDVAVAEAFAAENRAAEARAARGFDVRQMPENPDEAKRLRAELGLPDPPKPGRNPDLLVEGEYVDVYAPDPDPSQTVSVRADRALDGALKKVWDKGQAERIQIDLERSGLTIDDMAGALERRDIDDPGWQTIPCIPNRDR